MGGPGHGRHDAAPGASLGRVAAATRKRPTLVSVGYEGRTLPELVEELRALHVTVVADVRERASSRRPGFARTRLATGLAAAGIRYVHLPTLGSPPELRAGLHGDPPDEARARYGELLRTRGADALEELAGLVRAEPTAVLCVERDEDRCHRWCVVRALEEAVPRLRVFRI
jgi:uncharacterized protein (DUF488 family)